MPKLETRTAKKQNNIKMMSMAMIIPVAFITNTVLKTLIHNFKKMEERGLSSREKSKAGTMHWKQNQSEMAGRKRKEM